uniref:ParA family protein n=1 Tax=Brachybacterium conglomeratum TaxID=47846 RepID=UPI003671ECD4
AIGENVLIMDVDPQGNASTGLGIDRNSRPLSSYDVLVSGVSITQAALKTAVPNLYIVPSTLDLLGVEMEISSSQDRIQRLRKALYDDPEMEKNLIIF